MKRRVLKNEAVSPVIATILMVAITVVLAATLYMMLPKGGDSGTQQSGSFGGTDKTTDSDGDVIYEIDFAKFSPPRAASELTFSIVTQNDSAVFEFDTDKTDTSATVTLDGETYTITYNDQVDNEEINSGDSLFFARDAGDLYKDNYEIVVLYDGDEVDSTTFRV